MIVGNAEKPQAYKKKFNEKLGLDYQWNKKAWMTSTWFINVCNEWIDTFAVKPEERHCC